MLFLKYLDDLEQERAMEAELRGKGYEFLIDQPHRWASWAAPKKDDGSFDWCSTAVGSYNTCWKATVMQSTNETEGMHCGHS